MLLKLTFNKMFTPAKFPLDSHDFQLSRLGGIGVVIYILLLETLSMVLGTMRRWEMTKNSPLVEGQLNLLFLSQVLRKHSGLSEWQQGQKENDLMML